MKAILGALVLFAAPVLADSIALTGTVRGFLAACKPGGHPDFEISNLDSGLVPGAVQSTLNSYTIHSTFTFRSGETLSFAGDGDRWIFVNGRLAIGLGGVRGVESVSQTVAPGMALSPVGMVPGERYSMDLFFAERHTCEPELRFETSFGLTLVPEPAEWALYGALGAALALAGRRRNLVAPSTSTKQG